MTKKTVSHQNPQKIYMLRPILLGPGLSDSSHIIARLSACDKIAFTQAGCKDPSPTLIRAQAVKDMAFPSF